MQAERVKMEKSTAGMKKKSRRPYCKLGPTVSQGSLLPEAVDESPNEPNLHLKSITTPWWGGRYIFIYYLFRPDNNNNTPDISSPPKRGSHVKSDNIHTIITII